jgi:toxin secretion/phage lysis holin
MIHLIFESTSRNDYIFFLLILILVDFITGNAKAWKWKVSDSSVGLKGIIKHSLTFLFYFLLLAFFKYVKMEDIGMIFIYLILFNYVLSIMENLAVMGIYMPKFLRAKVLNEMKRYTRKLGLEDNETDGQENK